MHNHKKYLERKYSDELHYGPINWRKIKRFERKMMGFDAVHEAYSLGEENGRVGKPFRNPYPRGRRNAAYQYGYNLDLMSKWGDE